MAPRLSFRRLTGLLVLGALFLLIGPESANASSNQQQAQVVEYPFGQGYQNTPEYIYNMSLVLQKVGNGTNEWVIPAHSTQSYNSKSCWCGSDGFKVAYGVIGGGACDVATWFYHAANGSGLLTAVSDEPTHAKIQGVPLPAVNIWNPRADLRITNNNDFDVVIHWDTNAHPGYIQLWVDTTAGSSAPTIVQQGQGDPGQIQPAQPQTLPEIPILPDIAPDFAQEVRNLWQGLVDYVNGQQENITTVPQEPVFIPPGPIPDTLPSFDTVYWNGQTVNFYVTEAVWNASVTAYRKHGTCDPRLVIAVAFSESSQYNNTAVSSAGAAGVWQFMPTTWETYWPKGPNQPSRNDITAAADAACRKITDQGLPIATSESEFVRRFAYRPVGGSIWNAHEGQAKFVWKLWQELIQRTGDVSLVTTSGSQDQNTVDPLVENVTDLAGKLVGPLLLSIALLLVALVIIRFVRRPEEMVASLVHVADNAPLWWMAFKAIFAQALRWWFFGTAIIVVLTPTLRAMFMYGSVSWLQGRTTLSNWTIAILVIAFFLNRLMIHWFSAKRMRDMGGYILVEKRKVKWYTRFFQFGLSVFLVIGLFLSVGIASQVVTPVSSNGPGSSGQLLPMEEMIAALQTSGLQQPNYDNIRAHYAEIVQRSNDVGYDPAFTMAIWIEESGASNYALYPTVADFGCISSERGNFDVQLSCFLSLWKTYSTSSSFQECRGSDNELSLREFLLIYEGGYKSCRANTWTAESGFPDRLRKYYTVLTGGGQLEFGP